MKKTSERNGASVQSLDRGLTVLRLLAERGESTATDIAEELGLHQSSASRLLRSLELAGFVCQPSYRRFALDYGVLHFAGVTMESFPEVAASVRVCAQINAETGWGTASVILREERLIYLARFHGGPQNASAFVSASNWPLHRSSPGLMLLYHQRGKKMIPALAASIKRHGTKKERRSPKGLYEYVRRNVSRNGVLALKGFAGNAFNVSGIFQTRRGPASLALFSPSSKASIKNVVKVLKDALAKLNGQLNPSSQDNGKE